MEVLGIDLSLTSTGVASRHGAETIKTHLRGAPRLNYIASEVLEVAKHDGDDALAVIEGYSFASKKSQAHALGELGGVVRLMLWRNLIPYVEITPTQRAKFATGVGNAGKARVVSAVSARTGIEFGSDDEVDAWVLREMGLARLNKAEFDWPKDRMKVLDKIDWSPWDQRIADLLTQEGEEIGLDH